MDDGPGQWVDKDAFVMPTIPEQLQIDPVFAALLHCAAFLEISGDESVDPDWAVEALEHMAFYLQRLDKGRIHGLSEQLERIRKFGGQSEWPGEFLEFVASFLEGAGVE